MTPASLDIALQRNGDYQETWNLTNGDGTPLDLSSLTLELEVRPAGGSPILYSSAEETGSSTVSGIRIATPATDGDFQVTIRGADFADLDGEQEIVRLAWDLRIIQSNGIRSIYARGAFILEPGVTQ